MDGGFLLDVVVGQGAAVVQVLAGVNEPLLLAGDAFLLGDLGLQGLDRVVALDLQGHVLSGEGTYEDLHVLGCCQMIIKCACRLSI